MESQRSSWAQTNFGLATSGELVTLDEGQIYCSDGALSNEFSGAPLRSTENWEEWCSGMDGLGGLIMLTASLIM